LLDPDDVVGLGSAARGGIDGDLEAQLAVGWPHDAGAASLLRRFEDAEEPARAGADLAHDLGFVAIGAALLQRHQQPVAGTGRGVVLRGEQHDLGRRLAVVGIPARRPGLHVTVGVGADHLDHEVFGQRVGRHQLAPRATRHRAVGAQVAQHLLERHAVGALHIESFGDLALADGNGTFADESQHVIARGERNGSLLVQS